jgi:hypothetical protein
MDADGIVVEDVPDDSVASSSSQYEPNTFVKMTSIGKIR